MSDEPKDVTPPEAAADKPAGETPAEPIKGEVSRTSAPGAGVSAAPVVGPTVPPAPAPPTTAPPAQAPVKASMPVPPGTAAPKPAAPAAEHKAAPPAGPPDPPPPADKDVPAFLRALQQALPGVVEHTSYWVGDWTIIVPAEKLLDVAFHLRDTAGARFDFCSDVTASDWPPRPKRFDVVYCLYSTTLRHRVRVKVRAAEADPVPSVTAAWPSANWLEREVYDLFGVNFVGHPDLRRILMPDEWQGHPQRKDYPLEGPGELLMENPFDWLKLRAAQGTADIE
jgi:NADH-quinone oxidoreductase subunit C